MIIQKYHPQNNGMVKKKYKLIIDIFFKILAKHFTNWVCKFFAVFWANWLIIHTSTNTI